MEAPPLSFHFFHSNLPFSIPTFKKDSSHHAPTLQWTPFLYPHRISCLSSHCQAWQPLLRINFWSPQSWPHSLPLTSRPSLASMVSSLCLWFSFIFSCFCLKNPTGLLGLLHICQYTFLLRDSIQASSFSCLHAVLAVLFTSKILPCKIPALLLWFHLWPFFTHNSAGSMGPGSSIFLG